jgi:hypothetical protein
MVVGPSLRLTLPANELLLISPRNELVVAAVFSFFFVLSCCTVVLEASEMTKEAGGADS